MPQDESVPYKFKQQWLLATGVGFNAAAYLSCSCPHLDFFPFSFPFIYTGQLPVTVISVNWVLFLLITELIRL